MNNFLMIGKRVVTQKTQQCHGCGRSFPPGSTLDRTTAVDPKIDYTEHWCRVCCNYHDIKKKNPEQLPYGKLRDNDPEGWEAVRKEVEDGK